MFFIAPYLIAPDRDLAHHFHPAHLADLRASGLTDDTIRAAGIYSLAPSLISHFFKRGDVPREIETTVCFPYQRADFARIKLFPALGKMKYAQPQGTSARLYVPFPLREGSVFICEGEKKTLAAHQHGLNACGIGGVWAWLSGGQPIDDLNLVQSDSRKVTIIPDSDVFQRVDLMRAIYALGHELRGQGANVYVVQIPQQPGAKVGLDDFLRGGGKVSNLEVFSLSHSIFKITTRWHAG